LAETGQMLRIVDDTTLNSRVTKYRRYRQSTLPLRQRRHRSRTVHETVVLVSAL